MRRAIPTKYGEEQAEDLTKKSVKSALAIIKQERPASNNMYPIADMLITILNAQAVKKESATLPFSKIKFNIVNILKTNGYLAGVERKKRRTKKSEHELLSIILKYDEHGPVINGIKLISRPSRRMYIKASQIRPVRSGYGISVISTPKGIMSSKEARQQNVGGEILFEIW